VLTARTPPPTRGSSTLPSSSTSSPFSLSKSARGAAESRAVADAFCGARAALARSATSRARRTASDCAAPPGPAAPTPLFFFGGFRRGLSRLSLGFLELLELLGERLLLGEHGFGLGERGCVRQSFASRRGGRARRRRRGGGRGRGGLRRGGVRVPSPTFGPAPLRGG
jgi:hypothetical protein